MTPVVYLVTNKINGNRYVGVTSKTISHRWTQHIYGAVTRRTDTRLARAIRKYGKESFEIIHVASCLRLEDARQVESDVITSLRPEYNQTGGGEFTAGRKLSKETIQKISDSNRGKRRTDQQKRDNSEIKKRQTGIARNCSKEYGKSKLTDRSRKTKNSCQ